MVTLTFDPFLALAALVILFVLLSVYGLFGSLCLAAWYSTPESAAKSNTVLVGALVLFWPLVIVTWLPLWLAGKASQGFLNGLGASRES